MPITIEFQKYKLIKMYENKIEKGINDINGGYLSRGAYNSGSRIKNVSIFITDKIEECIKDLGQVYKQYYLDNWSPRTPKTLEQIITGVINLELDHEERYTQHLDKEQKAKITFLIKNYSEEFSFTYLCLIKETLKSIYKNTVNTLLKSIK